MAKYHLNDKVWCFQINSKKNGDVSQAKISGNLSLKWPCVWEAEEDIDRALIQSVASACEIWLKKRLGTQFSVPKQIINDCSTLAYFVLPSNWRSFILDRGSSKSVCIPQFKKNLINTKLIVLIYLFDDMCEQRIGTADHSLFVEELAESCYKIFNLEYKNPGELQTNLARCRSGLSLPDTAKKQALWLDLARELEHDFGYSRRETRFFAESIQRTWDHHTWLGSCDYSHTFSVEGQRYFRVHTGAATATFEFALLLEGISVSRLQRQRKPWIRFNILIADLVHISNDILSYPKETEDQSVDNSIMAMVRENLGVPEAIAKCCDNHNKVLETLGEIMVYMKGLRIGLLPGMASPDLVKALEAGTSHACHFLQGQCNMKRYTGITHEIRSAQIDMCDKEFNGEIPKGL